MKITVFTPTYNRAYIIENLYRSLQRQTFHDFEWLVVDDGSEDSTERLLSQWKLDENPFDIRYYKKENGGKCRAINFALDVARGELFFTVDSDDYLTDDALQKVVKWFGEIEGVPHIKGVVANRGYSATDTANYFFSERYLDKSLLEMYSFERGGHKVFDGERAFVFYTDFHRKYKYPEFDGENFMTEAVVWNRMSKDGYLMRFYNDIIWIFEYQEDGLTKAGSKVFLDNPKGYGLWLKEKAEYEKISLKERIRMYYTFTCDLSERYGNKVIANCIGTSKLIIAFMRIIHNWRRILRR